MSHPSACGVSADDVAVLVHDDLLAIGQGHGIAAIADALDVGTAGALALKTHNGILDKFCVHGCSPFLTPKWCGCCNAGYG